MATVPFVKLGTTPIDGMVIVTWDGMVGGDNGQPMPFGSYSNKTVHVYGDVDAPLTMQGSNDPLAESDTPDAADWQTLKDNLGADIIFSAPGLARIDQGPRAIRPSFDGAGTGATVVVVGNKY